jgi:hypothetical protein
MTFTEGVKDAAAGSEEVVPDGDGYIIRARSPFFPYLIHEIVKGCWDLLSVDLVSQGELGQETLDDEVIDIMSGPQLYINLTKLIPSKDLEYLPYAYRLLLNQDTNVLREVLSGGNKAQSIMNNLIQQAKSMRTDYGREEYTEPDYDN